MIQAGEEKQLGEMQKGFDQSNALLQQGRGLYDEGIGFGRQGMQRYNALTDTNNPDALNAAFMGSAGIQSTLNAGDQALMRRNASIGNLASGQTLVDLSQYNQGQFQDWLGRERQAQIPLMQMYGQGIGAQAQSYGTQAGHTTDYYNGRTGLMRDNMSNILGLMSGANKAGDEARAANSQMALGGLNALASLGGAYFGFKKAARISGLKNK
jgi:hypothetical protein